MCETRGCELTNTKTPIIRSLFGTDFSKWPGDTVASFHSGSVSSAITCTDIRQEDIFGAPRSVFSFEGTRPYVRDEIVDSIGILSYSDGLAWGYSLTGAIINGVTYGTVLDVKERSSLVPAMYALYPNYPNPFNPTTYIQFTIAESRMVSLKIYDILGREIATLVHEKKNAGNYTVQWNAGSYPSGVVLLQNTSRDVCPDEENDFAKMIARMTQILLRYWNTPRVDALCLRSLLFFKNLHPCYPDFTPP